MQHTNSASVWVALPEKLPSCMSKAVKFDFSCATQLMVLNGITVLPQPVLPTQARPAAESTDRRNRGLSVLSPHRPSRRTRTPPAGVVAGVRASGTPTTGKGLGLVLAPVTLNVTLLMVAPEAPTCSWISRGLVYGKKVNTAPAWLQASRPAASTPSRQRRPDGLFFRRRGWAGMRVPAYRAEAV